MLQTSAGWAIVPAIPSKAQLWATIGRCSVFLPLPSPLEVDPQPRALHLNETWRRAPASGGSAGRKSPLPFGARLTGLGTIQPQLNIRFFLRAANTPGTNSRNARVQIDGCGCWAQNAF